MIGWVALAGAVIIAIVAFVLVVLSDRQQKAEITDLGTQLLASQRNHSASSAAVKIAEEHTARCQAVLAEIRQQVEKLAKIDPPGGMIGEDPIRITLRAAIQKLKGDVEAACFAAGSIPPKEKKT